jgi:hypothetical protein
MLPAFYYYAEHEGLRGISHGYYNTIFMLGNMGFNKAICVSSYVELNGNPTTLSCDSGTLSSMVYAGILPNNSTHTYWSCPFSFCGNPNATSGNYSDVYVFNFTQANSNPPDGAAYCTATYLRYYDLQQDFNSQCQGKKNCTFQITNYINYNGGQNDTNCTTNPAKVYM